MKKWKIRRTIWIAFLLVPGLILAGCVSQKGLTQRDVIITIKATACMGSCPVFQAEIYSNGYIIYEGEKFVENIGIFTGKLSKNTLEGLKIAFHEAGFFLLQDEYVEPWTDLPTIYLYYSEGKNHKKIKDYYGAPEELKVLEKKVIKAIESVRFKKGGGTFLLTK